MVDTLIAEVVRFEEITCHFNRKEKLYFPLLERRGIYTPPEIAESNYDRSKLTPNPKKKTK